VLTELKARLHAMGIEPLGALERTPTLVDSRVWPMPSAVDRSSVSDEAGDALAWKQ